MKALVVHFWKLFAVAIACVALVGLYDVKQKWEIALEAPNRHVGYAHAALELQTGNQKGPTTVRLKDGASVEGYFWAIEDHFLPLQTEHSGESKVVITVIPLENVSFIRLTAAK